MSKTLTSFDLDYYQELNNNDVIKKLSDNDLVRLLSVRFLQKNELIFYTYLMKIFSIMNFETRGTTPKPSTKLLHDDIKFIEKKQKQLLNNDGKPRGRGRPKNKEYIDNKNNDTEQNEIDDFQEDNISINTVDSDIDNLSDFDLSD